MILFDVCSIPSGMHLQTWFDLFKEGLILFDGKNGSVLPTKIDGNVSLIDVSELSHADVDVLSDRITKMVEKQASQDRVEADKVRENNKRLVEYLRDINK